MEATGRLEEWLQQMRIGRSAWTRRLHELFDVEIISSEYRSKRDCPKALLQTIATMVDCHPVETPSRMADEVEPTEGELTDVGRPRGLPQRRLNKTHGFMRFIIRNQHSRKDYEKQQQQQATKTVAGAVVENCRLGDDVDMQESTPIEPKAQNVERKTHKIRPGFETYKPPHARKQTPT